jgi:hypothetical protein|tara:strand:- start:474 stop:869 length:396 start_codon:yes stop_codon:yes gene_type:complete
MTSSNQTLSFNEHSGSSISPVAPVKSTERYHGTMLRESYEKGIIAATGTLDAKNKDRILENLIKVVFDDILSENSNKIKSNHNILKLNLQVIENAIKNTKLSNFNFDHERIASIIEGYAKVIEQKSTKRNV